MFMVLKRKQITVVSLLVLIAIAGYLNWKSAEHTTDEKTVAVNESTVLSDAKATNEKPNAAGEAVLVDKKTDYFEQSRSDRDIVRSKATEILNDTISNKNVSEQTKKDAEAQLLKMAADMEREAKAESLLSAKGYKKCIVFISDNAVTVTVGIETLTKEDIAKINDIVSQQTGNNNIKIVEVQ